MTEPIDAETYVALRIYIDAATAVVAGWLKARAAGECGDDCEPYLIDADTEEPAHPTIYEMAEAYYLHVPWQSVSLGPAEALAAELGAPVKLPPDTAAGRISWATWADRGQLIAALDAATPAEVRAEIGDLSRAPAEGDAETGVKWTGADEDGLGWWAVALSAAGVLAWLGRRTIWGFVISLGARRLLGLLAGAALLSTVGVGALQFLDSVGKGLADAGSAIPFVLGGVAAVVVAGAVVYAVSSHRRGR